MKNFLIFIILVAGGYLVYNNFIKEDIVIKVKEQLSVSKSTDWDYEHPSVTPSGYTAVITGIAKNTADYTVKNINIVYKLWKDSAKVFINKLGPGEEYNFTTKCRSRENNPKYKISRISYEK